MRRSCARHRGSADAVEARRHHQTGAQRVPRQRVSNWELFVLPKVLPHGDWQTRKSHICLSGSTSSPAPCKIWRCRSRPTTAAAYWLGGFGGVSTYILRRGDKPGSVRCGPSMAPCCGAKTTVATRRANGQAGKLDTCACKGAEFEPGCGAHRCVQALHLASSER